MKLRRLITRRRAKWVALCASVLLALAYAISGKLGFGWIGISDRDWLVRHHIACVEGQLVFYKSTNIEQRASRYEYGFMVDKLDRYRLDMRWQSGSVNIGPMQMRFAHVPLWIPLLLIAAPTAYLWRIDRRAKPWQCAKCRYDLRGLEGGGEGGGDKIVCPECGTAKGEG